MSFSNWRSYAAIGGLILAVCLGSLFSPWITDFTLRHSHAVTQTQKSEPENRDAFKTDAPASAENQQQRPQEYQPNCADRTDSDLCAQRRMAKSAEDQVGLNERGIWLLGATLIFTAVAAVAAGLTVWTMQRTAKRELRAYLSLKPATMNFDGTTPLGIAVIAENHGQTPASHLVNFIAVHFPDYPLVTGYNPGDPGGGISSQGLWPKATHPFKRDLGRPIAPELLQQLQAGTKRIFVFGLIRYRDVFGRPHYTKLCASLDWQQLATAPRTVDEATGRQAFTFEWEYDHQHNDFD